MSALREVGGSTWVLERMPAERDARGTVDAAAAGGCCSCCCCCLHTMGGLIAAATTKAPRVVSPLEPPTAVIGGSSAEPRYSVAKQYWLSLLVVCLVAATLVIGLEHRGPGTMEGLLLYAIMLPILQLAASVLVLITLLATRRRRPGHAERMSHLGRITLRAFIGGLIGIGLMIVIGIAL